MNYLKKANPLLLILLAVFVYMYVWPIVRAKLGKAGA